MTRKLSNDWSIFLIEAEHRYQPGLLFVSFRSRDERRIRRARGERAIFPSDLSNIISDYSMNTPIANALRRSPPLERQSRSRMGFVYKPGLPVIRG